MISFPPKPQAKPSHPKPTQPTPTHRDRVPTPQCPQGEPFDAADDIAADAASQFQWCPPHHIPWNGRDGAAPLAASPVMHGVDGLAALDASSLEDNDLLGVLDYIYAAADAGAGPGGLPAAAAPKVGPCATQHAVDPVITRRL